MFLNLPYLLLAVVIMASSLFFNLYKFSLGLKIKKYQIFLHFLGIVLTISSFLLFLTKEFHFTLLFYPGAVIAFLGFAAMVWTLLTIKQQSFIPRLKLITTGPYLHTRHPIYLSAIIMIFGLCVLASSLLGFVYAIVTTFVVLFLIKKEEEELVKRFGKRYKAYARRVPKFIPKY